MIPLKFNYYSQILIVKRRTTDLNFAFNFLYHRINVKYITYKKIINFFFKKYLNIFFKRF
jgi:hypothetical protein